MRGLRWATLIPLMGIAVACGPEQGVAPPPRRPTVIAPQSTVFPASAYKTTVLLLEGWFEDVNDANLIVGMANGNAVAMQLGGPVKPLSNGKGSASKAVAVNAGGAIAGSVNLGTQTTTRWTPSVWSNAGASPILLPAVGDAADINDRGRVVGTILRRAQAFGFVWDPATGNAQLLPPLPGDKETWAYAINNDMVILGRSGSTWISHTVLWLQSPTGWTVQQVLGGIDGMDLDQSVGVIGRTGQKASFGKPDHAGFFNTIGPSIARAVSRRGLAAGDDEGASPGWPTTTVAFVADHSGATTYLPLPSSQVWRASFGQGVNSCGLVVGTVWEFPGGYFSAQPVVWDPGC